jgi:signal recognition particle GTPase
MPAGASGLQKEAGRLKQFDEMKKMMKQMTNMSKGKKKGFKLPFM